MNAGPDREATPPDADAAPPPEPMRVGAILDVSVRILRRHWAGLLGVALLFVGPGALLTAATGSRFNAVATDVIPGLSDGILDETPTLTQLEFERLGGAFVIYVLATVVAGVVASLGAVAFSAVVGADFFARQIQAGEAIRTAIRRTPTVLSFILITTVVIVAIMLIAVALIWLALSTLGGSLTGGGGPGVFAALVIIVGAVLAVAYLTMRWAPALPAIANEDLGWRKALARSWHLSGDNVWRTFFIVVLGALLTALAATLISQILAILLVDVAATSLGLDTMVAESLALAAGAVIVAPLAPVLIAVLYFDLRIRRDGGVEAPETGV